MSIKDPKYSGKERQPGQAMGCPEPLQSQVQLWGQAPLPRSRGNDFPSGNTNKGCSPVKGNWTLPSHMPRRLQRRRARPSPPSGTERVPQGTQPRPAPPASPCAPAGFPGPFSPLPLRDGWKVRSHRGKMECQLSKDTCQMPFPYKLPRQDLC